MSSLPPILGHDALRTRLDAAMREDRMHHAYLFEGPRGVGKRTVAERIALAANCEASPELRPCGTCPTCIRIQAGNHPDMLHLLPDETKASRTIPVESVREVIRAAGFHRYGSRRRIVIVDPAEAMKPSAANALLKTLEEPPEGTGFILICNNASALLPTIVSRCQRVRFGAVPVETLAPWLEARGVAEAELVARLSLGCPGRALGLADGALEARRSRREGLLDVLGGDLAQIFKWSAALCKGNRQDWTPAAEEVLELLEDLVRDTVVTGSGSGAPLLNADIPEVVEAWTNVLWAGGCEAVSRAIDNSRAQLKRRQNGVPERRKGREAKGDW